MRDTKITMKNNQEVPYASNHHAFIFKIQIKKKTAAFTLFEKKLFENIVLKCFLYSCGFDKLSAVTLRHNLILHLGRCGCNQ